MDKCIIWKGAISKKGYGLLKLGKTTMYAHRVSYRLYNGAISRGMLVCHKCDNPICINPNHLFLGTPKQNTDDMSVKGRGLYGRTPISVTNIKTGKTKKYSSQGDFAKEIGFTQATISYAIKRKSLVNGLYKIKWYNTQKP